MNPYVAYEPEASLFGLHLVLTQGLHGSSSLWFVFRILYLDSQWENFKLFGLIY